MYEGCCSCIFDKVSVHMLNNILNYDQTHKALPRTVILPIPDKKAREFNFQSKHYSIQIKHEKDTVVIIYFIFCVLIMNVYI